ncbi:MAG: hypothetical protein V1750_00025 [Acidobacteriota bacterium]
MRSRGLAAVCALLATLAVAETREVRVFQVRFRPVREAASLVEPLLSTNGSMLLQPKLGTITVQDESEVIRRVTEALASWDVAPLSYQVRVRLVLASTTPPTPGPPGPLIEGIGSGLQKLFHFSSYQEVDTLRITAADGSTVEAAAGGRYSLRFVLRATARDPERLQLGPLEVSRRERGNDGVEVLRPLLRTTVSLRLGQTAIVGAARSEGANQALVLILWAEREVAP